MEMFDFIDNIYFNFSILFFVNEFFAGPQMEAVNSTLKHHPGYH